MIDLGMYVIKYWNIGEIIPEESFTKDFVEIVYESEHVCFDTKQVRLILDAIKKGRST